MNSRFIGAVMCRSTGFLLTLYPCVSLRGGAGAEASRGAGRGQLLLMHLGGVFEGAVDGVGTLIT